MKNLREVTLLFNNQRFERHFYLLDESVAFNCMVACMFVQPETSMIESDYC